MWRVTVSNLEHGAAHRPWLAARIEGEWTRTADGHIKASGKTDRIVPRRPVAVARVFCPRARRARLRALDASGTAQRRLLRVSSATLRRARRSTRAGSSTTWASRRCCARRAPTGLSGALQMTRSGRRLKLAAQDVQFELPRMFREPLAAQTVDGTVAGAKSDQAWTIESSDVRLTSADGTATRASSRRFPPTASLAGSRPVRGRRRT